jgi:photosystem II stability/assembly factor-like uncharacterized protein
MDEQSTEPSFRTSLRLTGNSVGLIDFCGLSTHHSEKIPLELIACMSRMQICVESAKQRTAWMRRLAVVLLAVALKGLPAQTAWTSVGPDGGDARSFAADPSHPSHLYLGTVNSWIYGSTDQGASWQRLAKLGHGDDLVLDSIVVDAANSSTIFVGAWKLGQPGGGLWVSHDGGKSWNETPGLLGQSIRSFAQAPSDAKILFAGTLEGVFRSSDSGASWALISPPGSREIHEIESLAVDPENPDIVYAGTWHLPWKTSDGGQNWKSIKEGVIEDSDVFSIIVDAGNPKTIYLSACSGIYKSANAGALFKKIEGIPSTARRTRVLMQDPQNHDTVYAGTTEGLYKTVDGGRHFARMTAPDVIVNDVYVDPRDSSHVLLATDRGGVLASTDAGSTFQSSNSGFSERKLGALLVDPQNPQQIFAGILNDKTRGGVFRSINGGAAWQQMSEGLDGRDVFALAQSQDGELVAGTSHGIFSWTENVDNGIAHWEPRNVLANTVTKIAQETHSGKKINVEKKEKAPIISIESAVNALDLSGDVWLASTHMGLVTSKDKGAAWQGGPVAGSIDYLSVAVHGATMVAARADGAVISNDAGATWGTFPVPSMLTRIHRVAFSADGTLWLGAREGVYFTSDKGKTWRWIERLPFRDIDDLSYDPGAGKVLVSSQASDNIYAIDPKTLSWKWWQTGYRIGLVRAAGSRLIAASLFQGVLLEPKAAEPVTANK